MLKIWAFLATMAMAIASLAQDFSKLGDIRLEEADDFTKSEIKVEQCADFILKHAIDQEEENRTYALAFIMRWMSGTPNYNFSVGQEMSTLTGGKEELLGVYLAALTKAALSKKEKDPEKINQLAKELYLDFCADKSHKAKPPRAVRKMLKQREA